MQSRDGGAGRDAELVPERRPSPLVDAERLGYVPARGERLHEQAIAGLAQRVVLDEPARRALGARELAAADPKAGRGVGLQRPLERVVEPTPPRVEPRKVVRVREQRTVGDNLGAQRRGPSARPVVLHDRGLGSVHGGQRLFDDGLPSSKWTLTHLETGDLGEIAMVYDRTR